MTTRNLPVEIAAARAPIKPGTGEYTAMPASSYSATARPPADQLWLTPIYLRAGTLNRIGINVTTAGGAGAVARMGVYADSDGAPGALLLDTTVTATATAYTEATISLAVGDGAYWLGLVIQGSPSPAPIVTCANTYPSFQIATTTAAWCFTGVTAIARARSSVTGALPDPAGTSGATGQTVPIVAVRYA